MSDTLTTPVAVIDDAGIHAPSFPDVLTYMQASIRGIYGDDVYLEPDSQDGQLLSTFAKVVHDLNSLAVAAYAGYSPRTATGVALSTAVKLIGMQRKKPSYSSVPLLIGGNIGAQIINGTATDDDTSQTWALPALVEIPISGAITVTATASTIGDVSASAGSITRIATPTRGWVSVINPEAAIPGAPVESDTSLRQRQVLSSAIPARGITDGMRANLLELPGVQRLRIYENSTGVPDNVNGIPPGAVGVVVEGGDTQQIATTIQATKGQGVLVGDTNVTVNDAYGVGHQITFSFVEDVPVLIALQINALAGYTTVIEQNIKNAVVAGAQDANNGSNGIGDTVFASSFFAYAKIDQTVGGRTYAVKSVSLSVGGSSTDVPSDVAGNLLFAGKFAPVYNVNNVSIQVV